MNQKQKIQFAVLVLAGLLALYAYSILWFSISSIPKNFNGYGHIFDVFLYLVVTYVLWLPIFMKVLTWSVASNIRPSVVSPVPEVGKKVAFITTFVPGAESAALLHRILPSLIRVKYPHDTWLLDEGNDPEAIAICKQYGVKHYSRHGKIHYNTDEGTFARKTKGGNHNAWYHEVGYAYDYVAQIDTDFIVHPQFLNRTLGFFKDPTIAFVGTPQVYGNTANSLIARGASQQTLNFYGPLLRGMDGMDTSMLIGANHVVRVAALKSVDYYSAHITEDLLTGMKLHAKGWKSLYVPHMLAIGEGPTTWKAYFNQQNRWAYGCMHILFNYSPRLTRGMSLRRAIYYLCIQQYYFSGIAMLLGVMCLLVYFFFGIRTISIDFMSFIGSYVSLIVITSIIDLWLQRFNIRPKVEKGIMWSGMYICLSVWPVFLMAFIRLFKRSHMVFKVTPKGQKAKKRPPILRLFIPHIVIGSLALGGFASSFYTSRHEPIMLFWAFLSGSVLLLTPLVPLLFRFRSKAAKHTTS